ncbi:MAG: WD40 repeat domain-containing protein [Prevotellaceae bacterium]|nr:WD40 repeat domain-containing protein [Prevotellaceae bacterium]
MKQYLSFVLCLLVLGSCGQRREKLLLAGSGWDKIVIIDKATKSIEWEYTIEKGRECNSAVATPDGNILFSYSKAAKLINRNKEELWTIEAPAGSDLQSASVLPNGNYLVAWCGFPATILEVDPKGKILSRTEFDAQVERAHYQFRRITKNKKGNYMTPICATGELREISPEGQTLKSVNVGGFLFCAIEMENGNYIVTCGDDHQYKEVNFSTGEIVKTVNAEDIEGLKFSFVAQFLPTGNGGAYICNWQGHNKNRASENYPQVIEIDAKGKIVWSINDKINFGLISTICSIE